ncbi:unknown [[Mannheimia] succiniciproducens MBEL55E]|uniref:Uncharacterized protein n=1 Tax=Mannheimia succiniciproducens (strain KCTC 0769BP / MBEL55E) TaxID=221988 RepID=Q65UH4_MANSM|nr:unknown [[Mannheimia] succiniciproducens MBEL55E]
MAEVKNLLIGPAIHRILRLTCGYFRQQRNRL